MSEQPEQLYSPANEESVLGAVIIYPESLQEINLEPTEFFMERNRFIWQAIQELRTTGQAIDFVTICSGLERAGKLQAAGGPSRITGMIADCPDSSHATSYAHLIHDDYLRRRTMQIATRLVNMTNDRDHKLCDFIPETIDNLSRMAMSSEGAVHWVKYLSELFDEIQAATANPTETYGIPTGILDYDAITGGLIPGEVMKLSGEPGVGKSMLAMQMVCHAASKGYSGACYHLEMSGRAIARRTISAMSGLTTRAMRTGKLQDGDWSKVTGAIEKAETFPVYMSDSSTWTTAGLRVDLERMLGLYNIRWCLVDYEALLCDDPDKDDNQRSKTISSRLHGIIKDLGLAGIVIDDMNKEGIKTSASKGQASLAGSARKLYDADSIWIMRKKKDVPNVIQLASEKLREGEIDGKRIVNLVRVNGIPEFKNVVKKDISVKDWVKE